MSGPLDVKTDVLISDNSSGNLEGFLEGLVDSKALHAKLDSWLKERLSIKEDGHREIDEPFKLEELCQFDHALEGLTFEQVLRMPSSITMDQSSLTEACLAVEDFLDSAVQGLWDTFWRDDGNDLYPFFVAGTNQMNGASKGPHCAALVAKCDGSEAHVLWEHISEFVLLGGDDLESDQYGKFPATALVSQAVFYALHLLLSRRIARLRRSATTVQQNAYSVFILVINSQGGGVVKVTGDVSELETNTTQVYDSAAAWVRQHANVAVSTIDKVWNRFGGVNWKDVAALQLVLATFCCMEQCRAPKRSIAELATQHNFRLLQRAEQRRLEVEGSSNSPAETRLAESHVEEIEEIEEVDEGTTKEPKSLNIEAGTLLWLEDSVGQRGFEVRENLSDGRHFVYTAIALDDALDDEAKKLLNVYIGAHPSQLEPSWEDMNTWYQVQRQARILNEMKQRALSSRYIPELVHSGSLLHPGTCAKQTPKGRCYHPWCGIQVLVTFPVGESLHKIFDREGILSSRELLECCHDCLSALQSAQLAGIQHANITPDHVVRVMGADGEKYHVLVEWGHAIMEEKDSPATSLNFSSTDALQDGKICPVSDIESLIYVLFYLCGGFSPQFDSVESALQWRVRAWARRAIQQVLGEASIVLKAFADYVDNLCGTPYAVDYGIWLSRLNRVLGREDMRATL
eukprot:c21053_g1_i1 orf=649-2706(-)